MFLQLINECVTSFCRGFGSTVAAWLFELGLRLVLLVHGSLEKLFGVLLAHLAALLLVVVLLLVIVVLVFILIIVLSVFILVLVFVLVVVLVLLVVSVLSSVLFLFFCICLQRT